MKKLVLALCFLFSSTTFAAETSMKKIFKDGYIRTMNTSLATYDFEKNKKNVFYVWASWCPACKANAANFLEHYARVKDCSNIGVSLINVEKSNDDANRAVKEWGFSELTLFREITDTLKHQVPGGIPKMIVTDNEGKILNVYVGGREIHQTMTSLKKEAQENGDCKK